MSSQGGKSLHRTIRMPSVLEDRGALPFERDEATQYTPSRSVVGTT